MPTITTHAMIDAPLDAVWDLMNQPSRFPDFAVPTDRMLDVGDGVVKQGYTYKEYGGIPPFKSDSTWVVTEFEPKTRQVHEGDDGKMRIRLDVRIVPAGEGSRLDMTIDLKPRWYMTPVTVLMWPLMMRKRTQDAMDETAANVKRIVEAAR